MLATFGPGAQSKTCGLGLVYCRKVVNLEQTACFGGPSLPPHPREVAIHGPTDAPLTGGDGEGGIVGYGRVLFFAAMCCSGLALTATAPI